MVQNINKLLDRGEELDTMVDKTHKVLLNIVCTMPTTALTIALSFRQWTHLVACGWCNS